MRLAPLAVRMLLGFVVVAVVAAVVLSMTLSHGPVPMHVRWSPSTTDADRAALEQKYSLTQGEVTDGRTRAYRLADTSTGNIRALVQDPHVEDTADINRVRFRPRFSNDPQRKLLVYSVAAGLVGAIVAAYKALNPSAA